MAHLNKLLFRKGRLCQSFKLLK